MGTLLVFTGALAHGQALGVEKSEHLRARLRNFYAADTKTASIAESPDDHGLAVVVHLLAAVLAQPRAVPALRGRTLHLLGWAWDLTLTAREEHSPLLRRLIQKQIAALLKIYRRRSAAQDALLGIADVLDLWRPEQMRFLVRGVARGGHEARAFSERIDRVAGRNVERWRRIADEIRVLEASTDEYDFLLVHGGQAERAEIAAMLLALADTYGTREGLMSLTRLGPGEARRMVLSELLDRYHDGAAVVRSGHRYALELNELTRDSDVRRAERTEFLIDFARDDLLDPGTRARAIVNARLTELAPPRPPRRVPRVTRDENVLWMDLSCARDL